MPSSLINVSVAYGQAETFWDVYFSPDQRRYAEVEDESRNSISVWIDPQTGKVSLNNGYEPRSQPFIEENSLFDNFTDAIVEELVNDVPAEDPAYTAFLAKAAADAEGRRERLASLELAIEEDLDRHDA